MIRTRLAAVLLAAAAFARFGPRPASAVPGNGNGNGAATRRTPRTTTSPRAPAPGARSADRMTRAFRGYALAVTAGGVAALTLLGLSGGATWDWRLLVLGGIVLLGELLPIDVPRRAGPRPGHHLDRLRVRERSASSARRRRGRSRGRVDRRRRRRADCRCSRSSSTPRSTCSRRRPPRRRARRRRRTLPLARLGGSSCRPCSRAVVFFVVNHVLAGIAAAMLAREPVGALPASATSPSRPSPRGCVLALAPGRRRQRRRSRCALVPLCLLPAARDLLRRAPGARATRHRACTTRSPGCPNRVPAARPPRARSPGRARRARRVADDRRPRRLQGRQRHARPRVRRPRCCSASARGSRGALRDRRHARPASAATSSPSCSPAAAGEDGERASPSGWSARSTTPFELDGMVAPGRARASASPASPSTAPSRRGAAAPRRRRAVLRQGLAAAGARSTRAAQDDYSVDRLLLASQLRRGIERGEIVARVPAQVPAARRPPDRRRGARALAAPGARARSGRTGSCRSPSRPA